jgi:hypothetical protein
MKRRSWAGFAEHLRRSLSNSLAAPVSSGRARNKINYHKWNVLEDESTGWEINSRILRGVDGFWEIARALEVIRDATVKNHLRLDYRTGLHLHLGWRPDSHVQVKRLIRLIKIFEPGLATIVTASRIVWTDGSKYDLTEPNGYCRPISTVFPKCILRNIRTMEGIYREARGQRNVTVNVAPLARLGTVEVRMLGGTLSTPVVLMWVSLWQQILWAASRTDQPLLRCREDADVLVPNADIVALANQHLSALGRERFLCRLRSRRARIVSLWRRHRDLRPWLSLSDSWGGV